MNIHFKHGPQKPSVVPILDGLNLGRSFFFTYTDKQRGEEDYQPFDNDSFTLHNGPRTYNYLITSGVWWLFGGDKPRLKMQLRSNLGAYAQPVLLPHIGVGGKLRIAVTAGGKTKWLDMFDSIDTVYSPGSILWKCSDAKLGVAIELVANQFIECYGFAATATVCSPNAKNVRLIWVFGHVGEQAETVVTKEDYVMFENTGFKYTRVFAGASGGECTIGKGKSELLEKPNERPRFAPRAGNACALFSVKLALTPKKKTQTRFLCVWGYSGYDKRGVDEAYTRLEFRPFADMAWLEEMKKRWFQHWIGKGLKPEQKFLQVRAESAGFVAQSVMFWKKQRGRLRIKTPETHFDTVVNNTAASLRMHYEYPGFLHGIYYCKYGKINCGYYGYECSGYHAEIANSLKFISGTQDEKGRQRYFMPVFSVSKWSEEQNFYFVEQVWYHYCWTGDRNFLKALWPSVQRTLEQALNASDPDDDGIMTAYYETWQCDTTYRGGKAVVHTGMAWAALKAAAGIANCMADRGSEKRYTGLLKRTEEQFTKQLWNREIGAFCSAEWNGNMRPRPQPMEQNYHIWRGLGDPMQKYMAMRYVRENFHLKTAPGVNMELVDDWWPILWSHHYVANGDSAVSYLSACEAGDGENYWSILKTIANTAYTGNIPTLHNGLNNDGGGSGMRQSVELDPLFMLAVVEGLFGIKPHFGDNLLILRPNIPRNWKQARIAIEETTCIYRKTPEKLSLQVTTPVDRKVRVELPVTCDIKMVTVNGKTAPYSVESCVGFCRVIIESRPAKEHRFEIKLGKAAVVECSKSSIINQNAKFRIRNAELCKVYDPQDKMHKISIVQVSPKRFDATMVPKAASRCTIFLELKSGRATWLHPVDLRVQPPWNVIRTYIPAYNSGGPAVVAPCLHVKEKQLSIEIQNNTNAILKSQALITVASKTFKRSVRAQKFGTKKIILPLAGTWKIMSPGSTPIRVEMNGHAEIVDAVNWELGKKEGLSFHNRLRTLDIGSYYNIDIRKLYGLDFTWRLDYTGCGCGIDQRNPLPPKDKKGYVLMSPPVTQVEYGILPEQCNWSTWWKMPGLKTSFRTPTGIPFLTGGEPVARSAKGNILALVSTEPYEQLPSAAFLELERPVRLEKIYLLTANLTKTLKCYYPGAEVIVKYTKGADDIIQLIPPYTMSCFVQNVSPRAYGIEFGSMQENPGPLMFHQIMGDATASPNIKCNLAISDIVADAHRNIASIELRCVASETVFGILGITLLEAK